MNVVKFPEVDTIAIADGCFDLPMCQAVSGEEQTPRLITCWELTDEEMEIIKKTRCVWLHVCAARTPPVLVDVHNPFETYADIIPLKKLFAQADKSEQL